MYFWDVPLNLDLAETVTVTEGTASTKAILSFACSMLIVDSSAGGLVLQ